MVLEALLLASVSEPGSVDTLGSGPCTGFSAELFAQARAQCTAVLQMGDTGPKCASFSTLIPNLIRGYVAATGGPERDLANWVEFGCPLGTRETLTLSGISPQVDGSAPRP